MPPGFAAVEVAQATGPSNDGLAPGPSVSIATRTTSETPDGTIRFLTVSVQPVEGGDTQAVLQSLATRPGSAATRLRGQQAVSLALAEPCRALSFTVDGKLVTIAGRDVPSRMLEDVGNGVERAPGKPDTQMPSPSPRRRAAAVHRRGVRDHRDRLPPIAWADTVAGVLRERLLQLQPAGFHTSDPEQRLGPGLQHHAGRDLRPRDEERDHLLAVEAQAGRDGCAGYYTKEKMYNGYAYDPRGLLAALPPFHRRAQQQR